jgi:hypothetical protein
LNKTSNLNFALGTCMGNRAKSLFHSVLFNKFLHETNLIALLFSNLEILSPKGTSHTNSDSEWGNERFVQQIPP